MKKQPLLYRSHQQVNAVLAKIKPIEGVCYASVEVIKGAALYSASSHKEWMQYYIKHDLYLDDPIFQAAIVVPELPVFWDSVALYTNEQIEVMKKRKEIVGAKAGMTICFETLDKKLLLTVGAASEEKIMSIATTMVKDVNGMEILETQLSLI